MKSLWRLAVAGTDLCVAEGHGLTPLGDVCLAGVVQLWVQTDVLRLHVHKERETERNVLSHGS